eukprot:TRINITY_DN1302_c0_g2_i2.p1 TRINITY_DN1302_c0_g2~~TRINITY_DN1302_c0_g2_i2.p1  ORF type:complete len:884 (+),score=250.98 TRINITY_DN1302_c0_g2_i2:365-3016(+)
MGEQVDRWKNDATWRRLQDEAKTLKKEREQLDRERKELEQEHAVFLLEFEKIKLKQTEDLQQIQKLETDIQNILQRQRARNASQNVLPPHLTPSSSPSSPSLSLASQVPSPASSPSPAGRSLTSPALPASPPSTPASVATTPTKASQASAPTPASTPTPTTPSPSPKPSTLSPRSTSAFTATTPLPSPSPKPSTISPRSNSTSTPTTPLPSPSPKPSTLSPRSTSTSTPMTPSPSPKPSSISPRSTSTSTPTTPSPSPKPSTISPRSTSSLQTPATPTPTPAPSPSVPKSVLPSTPSSTASPSVPKSALPLTPLTPSTPSMPSLSTPTPSKPPTPASPLPDRPVSPRPSGAQLLPPTPTGALPQTPKSPLPPTPTRTTSNPPTPTQPLPATPKTPLPATPPKPAGLLEKRKEAFKVRPSSSPNFSKDIQDYKNVVENGQPPSERSKWVSHRSEVTIPKKPALLVGRRGSSEFSQSQINSANGSESTNSSPLATLPSAKSAPVVAINMDDDDVKWGDPEKEAMRQRNNKRVILELLSTEKEYITDLEMIIEHIMKPMAVKKNFLTGENLVTQGQMTAIFSNLNMLPPFNKELVKRLEKEIDKFNQGENAMIGKVFVEVADFFLIYSQYFANQPVANKTIIGLRNNSQFDAFLDEKRDMIPEFKNLDLNAFLIKPTQRMCKYPLFLRELANTTRRTHPDYPTLIQALEKVDGVVRDINEYKRETENQAVLMDIRSNISGGEDFIFAKAGRSVIKQAEFKKVTYKGDTFKAVLYIFSDTIVLAKGTLPEKSKSFKKQTFKAHFDLEKVTVSEADIPSNFKKNTASFAFVVRAAGDQAICIFCNTPEERKQWMNTITEAQSKSSEDKKKKKGGSRLSVDPRTGKELK